MQRDFSDQTPFTPRQPSRLGPGVRSGFPKGTVSMPTSPLGRASSRWPEVVSSPTFVLLLPCIISSGRNISLGLHSPHLFLNSCSSPATTHLCLLPGLPTVPPYIPRRSFSLLFQMTVRTLSLAFGPPLSHFSLLQPAFTSILHLIHADFPSLAPLNRSSTPPIIPPSTHSNPSGTNPSPPPTRSSPLQQPVQVPTPTVRETATVTRISSGDRGRSERK